MCHLAGPDRVGQADGHAHVVHERGLALVALEIRRLGRTAEPAAPSACSSSVIRLLRLVIPGGIDRGRHDE